MSSPIIWGQSGPKNLQNPSLGYLYSDAEGNIAFVASPIGGGGLWGAITGQLSNQTDLKAALDAKENAITANNNNLIFKNGAGIIEGLPNYFIDSDIGSIKANFDVAPKDNNSGYQVDRIGFNLRPKQDSPNDNYNIRDTFVNFDPDSSGFNLGKNGTALRFIMNNINHQGTGYLGQVEFIQNNMTIGNGTDPIELKGFAYSFGFGEIKDNVTVTGPMQGYGFQPNLSSGAIVDNGVYVQSFYDNSNIYCAMGNYTSFNASPNIAEIKTNNNYNAYNVNANIPSFEGNAGFTGFSIYGNLGTFDTGSFNGITVSPNITSVNYAVGLNVDMSNVTIQPGGSKRAAYFKGDVRIEGDLSFTGALELGKLNAFAQQELVDTGGAPGSIHSIISAPFIGDNETVANADVIGVNTAALITIGENSTVTTAFLGVAALGLPAVLNMKLGSTIDKVSGATFAVSLDGTSTGGTVGELALCKALAIPNGVTTITELYGYEMALPFGDPGSTTWGLMIRPSVHNFLGGNLKIGGTTLVANASVALEIESTSKAFVLSRMDTTARDAMSAIAGMVIFNLTTNTMQYFNGTIWV